MTAACYPQGTISLAIRILFTVEWQGLEQVTNDPWPFLCKDLINWRFHEVKEEIDLQTTILHSLPYHQHREYIIPYHTGKNLLNLFAVMTYHEFDFTPVLQYQRFWKLNLHITFSSCTAHKIRHVKHAHVDKKHLHRKICVYFRKLACTVCDVYLLFTKGFFFFSCQERDVEEGADYLMVKPGMPYLDVVRDTKNKVKYTWPLNCCSIVS